MRFTEIKYPRIFLYFLSPCGAHPKSFPLLYFLSPFTCSLHFPSLVFYNLYFFFCFFPPQLQNFFTLSKFISSSLFHLFSLSAYNWKRKIANWKLKTDNSDLTCSIERFGNRCQWLDLSNLEATLLSLSVDRIKHVNKTPQDCKNQIDFLSSNESHLDRLLLFTHCTTFLFLGFWKRLKETRVECWGVGKEHLKGERKYKTRKIWGGVTWKEKI